MLQYNPTVSGSLTVTGTISATQGITGSFSGSIAGLPTDTLAFSSSLSTRITNTELTSSEYVSTSGSLSTRVTAAEATSSAYVTASGSLSTRVTAAEATASAYVTASGSLSTRTTNSENYITAINAKTGSYATTGSNYFIGTQVVTGSVYISSDLVVQGSSSLQNITASAVSIGTNTVILNTDSPILRFGGISVQDSGSSQGRSGSLFWDSVHDHWIYVVPSGSAEGYNSAMLMNGPKNTGSLGDESGLTSNYIPVAQGEDHITDSIIFQSASVNIGIGVTAAKTRLHVSSLLGSANALAPPALGFANSSSVALFTNFDAAYGTLFGTTNAGNGWIQQQRVDGTGTAYALTLQPTSGNVGIGNLSPSYKTHIVASGSNAYLGISNQGSADGDRQLRIGFGGNGADTFASLQGTRLSIADDVNLILQPGGANVGIGITSPSYKLDVSGDIHATSELYLDNGYYLRFKRSSGGTSIQTLGIPSGTDDVRLLTTGDFNLVNGSLSYLMTVKNDGKVGIGVTSPRFLIDTVALNGTSQQDYIALGPYNGPDTGGGTTLGSGIIWKPNYSGYTKRSAGIVQIGEGDYFRSGLAFYTNGTADSTTDWSERMRIASNGKVGIGNTSPNAPLDVSSASTDSSGIQQWSYNSNPSSYRLQLNTIVSSGLVKYSFDMLNAGSTYNNVLVLTNGNVGIGKTNPSYKLDVTGDIRATNELKTDYRITLPGMTIGYWDSSNNRIEGASRPLFITAYSQPIIFGPDGTETLRIEATTGELIQSYTNSIITQRGGSGYSLIRLYGNTSNVELQMSAHQTSGLGSLGTYTSSDLMFKTSNAERMRITSGGNVGIGVTNPSSKLEVNGTITESSSIRYKENIETLTSGLDKVLQMRGVSYIKKDIGIKEIGVIAEEINEILPDVVIKNNEGEVESVAYGRLTAILIEAVKELKAEINVLKSK